MRMSEDDATEQMGEVVRTITDIMLKQQNIGLDFQDLRTILETEGTKGRRSYYGAGEASGEHRAKEAAELAVAAIKKNIALGK